MAKDKTDVALEVYKQLVASKKSEMRKLGNSTAREAVDKKHTPEVMAREAFDLAEAFENEKTKRGVN